MSLFLNLLAKQNIYSLSATLPKIKNFHQPMANSSTNGKLSLSKD